MNGWKKQPKIQDVLLFLSLCLMVKNFLKISENLTFLSQGCEMSLGATPTKHIYIYELIFKDCFIYIYHLAWKYI